MSEFPTLAEFVGSKTYYIVIGAALVVLIIIWRVLKGRTS